MINQCFIIADNLFVLLLIVLFFIHSLFILLPSNNCSPIVDKKSMLRNVIFHMCSIGSYTEHCKIVIQLVKYYMFRNVIVHMCSIGSYRTLQNCYSTSQFIDWCFTPTLAIFQLYRGVIKFYYYTYTPTISLEKKHKT